jgi:hypothetical protein
VNDYSGVTFQAIFAKASTLIDGSWRISFDVNPDHAVQVMQTANLKDLVLQIAIVPVEE